MEANADEADVHLVVDGDDEKALELGAYEGEILNCIMQNTLWSQSLKRITNAIRFSGYVALLMTKWAT